MIAIHRKYTNPDLTTKRIISILKNPEQIVYSRLLAESISRNIPYTKNKIIELFNIFNYLKKRVRFLRDIFGVETIKTPKYLYNEFRKFGKIVGDCDDLTMLLASILRSIGYPVRLVISAVRYPFYNHIYLEVFINAKWYPLDLTINKPFKEKPYIFRKVYEL